MSRQPAEKLSHMYAFALPSDVLHALKPGTVLDRLHEDKERSESLEPNNPEQFTNLTHDSLAAKDAEASDVDTLQTSAQGQQQPQSSSSRGCATCDVATFASVTDQRAHFRSDWHRYNVKMRLSANSSVSEDKFAEMIDSLSDSISGSDTESSSESDALSDGSSSSSSSSSMNAVSRLLHKHAVVSSSNQSKGNQTPNHNSSRAKYPRSPFTWFTVDSIEKDIQLGFYQCSFPGYSRQTRHADISTEMISKQQLIPDDPRHRSKKKVANPLEPTDPYSRTWSILMVAGGHFAGMIVSLVPKYVNKGGGRYEREPIVLERKTFHRYTTRRKQGGGQGMNDNSKGNAKSAGASLRRYGEAALENEIKELLESWNELIGQTEAIFIRASRTNMHIFCGGDEPSIDREDPRLRTIPFQTRRPTVTELERVFDELTHVKMTKLTSTDIENILRQAKEEEIKLEAKKQRSEAKAAASRAKVEAAERAKTENQLTPSEEQSREQWMKVLEMVRKGRLEALKGWIERHGTQMSDGKNLLEELPSWCENETRRGWTSLLHLASASDAGQIVQWLLSAMRMDPRLKSKNGASGGPTPFEVAASRSTRNVFRKFRASEPDAWDWDAARIPSALTEEQETEQKNKVKERRSKMKEQTIARRKEKEEARRKEEEARRKEEEAAATIAAAEAKKAEWKAAAQSARGISTGPQKLGGRSAGNVGGDGLSDAAKAKMERERRARAAEARMKAQR